MKWLKMCEDSLCGYLKTSRFSIQLDESTLLRNEALLLTYENQYFMHALDEFFKEKEIPLGNILSIATDGAPAMVGRYRGFLAYLKKEVPNAFTVHSIIHRQHLVAKNLSARLHNSLQCVIKAINTIRSKSLNDRLFKQLFIENNEEFNRLLLHTEVRWLSKGACLDRFYKLFNSVLEFLKDKHDALRSNLIQSKIALSRILRNFVFHEEAAEADEDVASFGETVVGIGPINSPSPPPACSAILVLLR
ncbi:hypothetical protein J437_LFUL000532 [Ladona fulva]|uniref:SCAN domain-containing protein 3 n=1 Tax=Ladona fulva TaxID=123851 RepID=A0A8K0JUI5_LADFU|nr:hypothetical protein J437_LFUL000532 [Ladona fulva]